MPLQFTQVLDIHQKLISYHISRLKQCPIVKINQYGSMTIRTMQQEQPINISGKKCIMWFMSFLNAKIALLIHNILKEIIDFFTPAVQLEALHWIHSLIITTQTLSLTSVRVVKVKQFNIALPKYHECSRAWYMYKLLQCKYTIHTPFINRTNCILNFLLIGSKKQILLAELTILVLCIKRQPSSYLFECVINSMSITSK